MSVVLELPGVWLDQVILDDLGLPLNGTFFRVINRDPEPDNVVTNRVRADTLIAFDLTTDAADSPNLTTTQVFVKVDDGPEVLVYDGAGAGFQPGWDGPGSATSSPDAQTARIVIDPTADFGSEQTVTVHVVATSTGAQSLNTEWVFTIEDLTAPTILSAKATGKDTLVVTFSEDMDSATALVPGNYAIARQTVPAVNVEVESVVLDTTVSVELTLDIEMTPGATYLLQVSDLEDLVGNVIAPPFNAATFTGFQPIIPDGRSFDLWRMVPRKNRDEDPGDLLKFVRCLQEVTDLLLCQIDTWTEIIDPDRAPEAFVDAILADLGNPFEFDLDEADKRRLVRILVPIYQQKGTGVGIVNAVRFFLGVEVSIFAFNTSGWILGEDELGDSITEGTAILGPGTTVALYSFDIESPVALTPEQRQQIRDIANYMKPAHTHLINITEPEIPTVIDHLELGLSELGDQWILH